MKFQYTVNIPSLGKEIFIRELTTGQQKELVKSLQGHYNYEFVQNTNALLKEVISTPLDIDSLTLIDKLLILMRLRSISISDVADYKFSCEKCGKDVKVSIQLSSLITALNCLRFPFTFCEGHNQYIITCDLPTVRTEFAYEEVNKTDYNKPITDYGEFVGNVFIHDLAFYIREIHVPAYETLNVIKINELSYLERCEVIKKLPAKLLQKTWEGIKKIKKNINIPLISATCLCKESIIDMKLDLNGPSYAAFVRSIFNENLHNVYQTIYYMVNVLHFPPQYVEDMIPGERTLYWGYYKEQKERGQKGEGNHIPIDNPEFNS